MLRACVVWMTHQLREGMAAGAPQALRVGVPRLRVIWLRRGCEPAHELCRCGGAAHLSTHGMLELSGMTVENGPVALLLAAVLFASRKVTARGVATRTDVAAVTSARRGYQSWQSPSGTTRGSVCR
jgi:hypothetical protein